MSGHFDPKQFGALVRRAMGSRTIRQLSPRIGISPATLNRVARDGMPNVPTYLAIKAWLNSPDGLPETTPPKEAPPMNPHQKPQEDVVVTQEDRKAAAQVAHGFNRHIMESCMRTGRLDHHIIVQAFARHRLLGHEAGRRDMREEAGKVCRDQQVVFLSPQYATGQPLSSFGERFACGKCAEAIEALPTEPLGGEGGATSVVAA